MGPYRPEQVIPQGLAHVVEDLPSWFVIGGHAVRCLCPYRPTRDVDFGLRDRRSLEEFVARLEQAGRVELLERSDDTVHLRWNDIDVSVFLLGEISRFTEGRCLSVEGLLATKVHAIIDRGTRRDFFDLYVVLQSQQLGIAESLRALRAVYRQEVNDALVLRALTWFDDADREAPLPGEGDKDWKTVKEFFLSRVGYMLVPPAQSLEIQQRSVDVVEEV